MHLNQNFSSRGLYATVAAISVIAAATAGQHRLTRVIKPTLMPLLAARAIKRSPDTTTAAVLVAGLSGGLAGDIILMGDDSTSTSMPVRARNLNRGGAAFALNHLSYHYLLLDKGARPRPVVTATRIVAWLVGVGVSAARVRPALPAGVGYGAMLATTDVLANDSHAVPASTGIGGSLFVASDALLLARIAFLLRQPRLHALADALVMATYTAAQLLLVDGITEEKAR